VAVLRAYCSEWDGGDAMPELDQEEMHHLVRVRRVRVGETVEILNGRGHVGKARVDSVDKRFAQMALESVDYVPEPRLQVHLLVALPKGKTFPALLHKAVELGASAITPLVTDHVEVAPSRADEKREHWEAVLVEALKQSGNPWMPELHAPVDLKDYLNREDERQLLCAALQPDAQPLWKVLRGALQPDGLIDVFVGPEGDFSDVEYTHLRESGCLFCSLGPLVLKVETAASLVMGTLQVWAQGVE
jgi:16S rRNA (uracil1498-N3)-methyltransferase